MKRLFLVIPFLLGLTLHGLAQKVVQKNLEVTGKSVNMKFDFADTIEIVAWDKNTLALEVSANIDNNRCNDDYNLKVEEYGSSVKLEEFVDFKNVQKKRGNKCNIDKTIIYKLKVPQNLQFSLKTIAGQVVLKGTAGQMDVNSISGFIDYSVPATCKANIKLSTVTGNVYSNLKFDEKKEKEMSWVGTDRKLTLNGGGREIAMKTVSGDIYLRK
jgi:hypothetical protein